MEIAFRTKALRAMCLSGKKMIEQFGAEGATTLKGRLADLRAAECLDDVQLATVLPFTDGAGANAILDLSSGIRLIVRANHKNPPKRCDGGINWSEVYRILIERIIRTDA